MVEALEGDFQSSDHFTPAEKAAIKWAEVLTEKTYFGQNPKAMPELKEHFNSAQIVEITMISGFFNFWNRFTDSLQIDIEDAPVMEKFTKSVKIDPADYVAYMRDCWWNHEEEGGTTSKS
ncbi:MAG: hypothetical protein ABJ215_02960 [Alphaproteobacteria bacterium]